MTEIPSGCPPDVPEPALSDAGLGQVLPGELGPFCSKGLQPVMVTGTILELLRRQFSQPETVGEATLRNKVWRPTDDTDILIESIHRWLPQEGRRPALLVKPHGYAYQRLGQYDDAGHENYQRIYARRRVGTHTVFAVAHKGEAADLLATEAERCLTDYSPLIRETLRLKDFFVHEIGDAQEIEEYREAYAVPVNCVWVHNYSWKLNRESPILKEVRWTPAAVMGWR